jgi:hypothetical protein
MTKKLLLSILRTTKLVRRNEAPVEGFGGDMRTQTIMQGANHCDFRYSRQKD